MSFGSAASGARSCPCGSGLAFDGCCGPLLAGEPAPSAERLMRSRYTAFARRDAGYLERTWHPRTRPDRVDIDRDTAWEGLEIVDAPPSADGESAEVEFRARWRDGALRGTLHERSRFTRRGGRWLYLDGDVDTE